MSVLIPTSPLAPRVSGRLLRCGLAALLGLAAFGSACADDPAPEVSAPVPDAGPACERGTQGCACMGGSGCRDELLCIAGRCLLTQEGPSEPEAPPRPPPPGPPPLVVDGDSGAAGSPGVSPASPDAGPEDAGADASR